MNYAAVLQAAGEDRLYPAVILYGANTEARQAAAVELSRCVLCEKPAGSRPCDLEAPCRHCARVSWPPESFHPDFHVLERDLRTATSTAATKKLLSGAYAAPFEARGQVYVIAEADTLAGGAADSLLKILEEPPKESPRTFFLLAASRLDLSRTLRSRSLSVYLGPSDSLDPEEVNSLAEAFGRAIEGYFVDSAAIHLLCAAEALSQTSGWQDPRNRRPWAVAAAAISRYLEVNELESSARRALLEAAEALLDGPRLRLRGVTHGRILEGLLTRHLTHPIA
ncbi:MAG: hypothetical protein AAF560_10460 [Acidobacteriota bacterium]